MRRGFLVNVQWGVFITLTFLSALFFSWLALAQANFFYPFWHDTIGIDQTIATYGPQNRYRDHFELTSKEERERLFAGIVDAIHEQGEGLAGLTYHAPDGHPIARLLTPPEIVHLRDVARLVSLMQPVGWGAFIGWLFMLWALMTQGSVMPGVKTLLSIAAAALILIAGIVLLVGPVRVFHALHIWIFPPDHQWFFYYQDSLMSMMMQAPNLFGYIAVIWVLLSLVIAAAMLMPARRLINRRSRPVAATSA